MKDAIKGKWLDNMWKQVGQNSTSLKKKIKKYIMEEQKEAFSYQWARKMNSL